MILNNILNNLDEQPIWYWTTTTVRTLNKTQNETPINIEINSAQKWWHKCTVRMVIKSAHIQRIWNHSTKTSRNHKSVTSVKINTSLNENLMNNFVLINSLISNWIKEVSPKCPKAMLTKLRETLQSDIKITSFYRDVLKTFYQKFVWNFSNNYNKYWARHLT